MQVSAMNEFEYKGTPLLANEWVCRKIFVNKLNQNIQLYEGVSNYQDLLVASKIALNVINDQQSAADLGYLVIQPAAAVVPVQFPWGYLVCSAVSAIVGGIAAKVVLG